MKRQKGFIMLEGLVGVAILGLVVLFVISTFGMRLNFDKRNDIRAKAFYLAEQGIERVRAHPEGINTGEFQTEDFGTIEGYPRFKREYRFSQVSLPAPGSVTVWEVRVGVMWRKDASSTPWRALELVSYVVQKQ